MEVKRQATSSLCHTVPVTLMPIPKDRGKGEAIYELLVLPPAQQPQVRNDGVHARSSGFLEPLGPVCRNKERRNEIEHRRSASIRFRSQLVQARRATHTARASTCFRMRGRAARRCPDLCARLARGQEGFFRSRCTREPQIVVRSKINSRARPQRSHAVVIFEGMQGPNVSVGFADIGGVHC